MNKSRDNITNVKVVNEINSMQNKKCLFVNLQGCF